MAARSARRGAPARGRAHGRRYRAVVPGGPAAARALLGLRFDPPPPRIADAAAIFAHNLLVLAPLLAGSPLVAWLGRGRRLLSAYAAWQAAWAVLTVGVALGAYGPRLLPWLVHVPVEWAAFSVALGRYIDTCAGSPLARSPKRLASVAMLLVAAGTEVFATPAR